jgi:hypothetical protein
MMHPELIHRLSQMRSHDLLMEAEQTRIIQELKHTRTSLDHKAEKHRIIQLTIRYARSILLAIASLGFAHN